MQTAKLPAFVLLHPLVVHAPSHYSCLISHPSFWVEWLLRVRI